MKSMPQIPNLALDFKNSKPLQRYRRLKIPGNARTPQNSARCRLISMASYGILGPTKTLGEFEKEPEVKVRSYRASLRFAKYDNLTTLLHHHFRILHHPLVLHYNFLVLHHPLLLHHFRVLHHPLVLGATIGGTLAHQHF